MVYSKIITATLFALFPLAYALPIGGDIHINKRTTNNGRATYYETGTGACGYTDSDSDPIVAISHLIYGSGANCDQWMQITNTANGQSQYGKIRDECQGCGQDDIDLSPSLFESLGAPLSQGVLQVQWQLMPVGFSP